MVVQPPHMAVESSGQDLVAATIEGLGQKLVLLDSPEQIHAVRVHIKQLRSWLQLAANATDKESREKLNLQLRNASRELAGQRDRHACIETLQWLDRHEKSRALGYTISKIIRDLSDGIDRDESEPEVSQSDQLVNQLWEFHHNVSDRIDVESGLRRTFRKAQKIGELAFSNIGSVDDLHRFRKWCKYLFYQLVLFPELDGLTSKKDRARIKKIGKVLGRFHDLILIRAYVACQSNYISFHESERLMRAIHANYLRLHAKSQRLYVKTF